MTKDKLIAMAKEAGLIDGEWFGGLIHPQLQAFANLIRRDQIERDAWICRKEQSDPHNVPAAIVAARCAEEIRNQELT